METFFINLIRGTGLRGLTGIGVVNGRLIRPLLFSQRKEIIDYALTNKIPYREDSTNASTKYLRNKFRLGIVPRIKEISPKFTDTMAANVERLTSAQNFIDRSMEVIRRCLPISSSSNCCAVSGSTGKSSTAFTGHSAKDTAPASVSFRKTA